VARVRFSRHAETDLLGIVAYSVRTWGEDQALRYVDGLEAFCRMLADNPSLGRRWDDVRRGLRRMESGQHVLLYRQEAGGILVSRILHGRMLPNRYAMDDEDDPTQKET
jgi:toxin ParE1/3/4